MKSDHLKLLFKKYFGAEPDLCQPLAPTASNRLYYRLSNNNNSCIGVINNDLRENDAFVYLSKHFLKYDLPVPEVFVYDAPKGIYLQSDLGDQTLFDFLKKHKQGDAFPKVLTDQYKEVLKWLPKFQTQTTKDLDFQICYPRYAFDRQSMMWDMNYFKYYFLKLAGVSFDEQELEDEFNAFADYLLQAGTEFFLYRDFQSRNIMLKDGKPWFIDFQGGRKGALQYDLASLLYDAKAGMPENVREELLEFYIAELKKYRNIDEQKFRSYFYAYVFIRIMQALGAYGYRGFYERKAHFLQSIPYALKNLQYLLDKKRLPQDFPLLGKILNDLCSNEALFELGKESSGLCVHVASFSYKKGGIPKDSSGNGGGFVFDCRALPNPGREEQYRKLTGNDRIIIDYLEKQTEVHGFFAHVRAIVQQSVENYKSRKFEHLMVSFGCTGGQHRSVYFANQLTQWLRNEMDVEVQLVHNESNNWPANERKEV